MNVPGVYRRLQRAYGPQRWWPVSDEGKRIPGYDRRFEIITGAILTQMVSWANVEKAIANLIRAGALSSNTIRAMPASRLARHIRPAGYYRQKAKKLKAFVRFLDTGYSGSLDALGRPPVPRLRAKLLSVHGIGEETADSIILYAFRKPSFVVDAYTRRLCECFGIRFRTYGEYQQFFTSRLPSSVRIWSEFHALIVRWGKDFGTGQKKTSAEACRMLGAKLPVAPSASPNT